MTKEKWNRKMARLTPWQIRNLQYKYLDKDGFVKPQVEVPFWLLWNGDTEPLVCGKCKTGDPVVLNSRIICKKCRGPMGRASAPEAAPVRPFRPSLDLGCYYDWKAWPSGVNAQWEGERLSDILACSFKFGRRIKIDKLRINGVDVEIPSQKELAAREAAGLSAHAI